MGQITGLAEPKRSSRLRDLAALMFLFLFLDNLLRRLEEGSWAGFWPRSGRLDAVVMFGALSVVAQILYWSRIVRGLNHEQV